MIRINFGDFFPRKSALVIAVILVLSISQPQTFLNDSYATPLFEASTAVSADGVSSDPHIAVSDPNVYLVWQDGSINIAFSFSNDDGVTFTEPFGIDPPTELSSDFGSSSPQIAASGTDAYVVWQNAGLGFTGNISFLPISDSGLTIGTETEISSDFSSSSPQIAASGTDAYVVWQNAVGNISFIPISSGVPGAEIELSFDNAFTSPQIAASGTDAYVVWQNGNGNISFLPISDSGLTIGTETELSSGSSSFSPQIDAVGTDVYVTWQDSSSGNSEIMFKKITGSGTGFANPVINLSSNSGNSFTPQITTSGSDVYVTWADATLSSGGLDVLFKASSDNGDSFGGLKKLNTDGISFGQQIAASASNVSVVWSQDDGSGILDIFFASGEVSSVDVNFDSVEYRLGDAAVITVNDPSKSGDATPDDTIFLDLTSTTTPVGITLTLTEDANTGVFTGAATLTAGPTVPDSEITVGPGDLLTATYTDAFGTQTAIASVFQRTVAFDFDTYDRGQHAHITVTDQNSNLLPDTAETIEVQIISDANPAGITLVLTEDDLNSGVFGGILDSQSDLIFAVDFDGNMPSESSVTITQPRPADITSGIDTIDVTVASTSTPGGITLTLTETGDTTAIFSGILSVTEGPTVLGSAIHVEPGDILSVTDVLTSNALITPNPIASRGVIQVNVPSDTITVSFLGSSDTGDVANGFGEGGGGGGISRAGFVVNVVAGTSLFGGGGGGNSPPFFGKSSFAILSGGEEGFGGILNDNDVNTLEQTKTFKVGEKAVLRFDFTEGGGIGKIEHIGLYTNVRDGQKRQDSDAYIYYDPLKSPQVTVHDPNGLFSEANFELLQEDVTKFVLKYELTFAKPMATSDLILESWNIKKWSTINKIPNAIEVISSGIIQEEEESEPVETFLEDVTDDTIIPVWVKSNAKWWSDGKIDNDNFISGLEYLVNEGIITVSLPEGTDNSISEVQPWIKSTAGWWADGMISEDEFITAIEWLISNNIIQVAA